MNRYFTIVIAALALQLTPTAAQSLYKCTTPQGSVEYRNSPCEAGQKNAGSVQKGAVTSLPSSAPPAPNSNSGTVGGFLSLDKISNPVKALREDSAPIDKVEAGLCRNNGGHFVQGAGCLDSPPSNRNPSIGEPKMREICKKLDKSYIKALNDCVDKSG